MGWWLLDPDGYRNNFEEGSVTADDVSLIVLQMMLIYGYDWVQVRSDEDPGQVTEWLALERDGQGTVTKIGVREPGGEISVINNRDYPEVWNE